MKKIGMIGGLGPESTLDYYDKLIKTYREKSKSFNLPEIIVYSLDLNGFVDLVDKREFNKIVNILSEAINSLYKAGASFAFISSNTPHFVFNKVKELSPIPLISIVEETCKDIKQKGIKKCGLLGTQFTMESNFYKNTAEKYGVELIAPEKDDIKYIHNKLMTEIELGIFKEETRQGLLNIIEKMINKYNIEGIILGCTELPLILTKSEFGIPFFNTTQIHVNSIVDYYLNN